MSLEHSFCGAPKQDGTEVLRCNSHATFQRAKDFVLLSSNLLIV